MREQRLHPLTPFVRAWLIIVAFAWFVAKQLYKERNSGLRFEDLPWWVWLFLVLPALFIAIGVWEWWTTHITIDSEELRIERRGLTRDSQRIAYSRIQSVDVTQPLTARLLGLAELKVDVGADQQVELSYLGRARALELRSQLLERAHRVRESWASDVLPDPGDAGEAVETHESEDVLVRLGIRDLVLGALLAHQFWVLILVWTVVVLGVSFYENSPRGIVGAGAIPFALAAGGFLWSRIATQFGYSLTRTPTGLKVARGLTTLRSSTVPVHRVQAAVIEQSILWRLVGRQRVSLVILGGGALGQEGDSSFDSLLLPIGTADQVCAALHAIWPALEPGSVRLRQPPHTARWVAPLAYGWLGYGHDDRVVVNRVGWLTRKTFIIPHQRIQSLSLDQGPIDRLLGIATVALHTSSVSAAGRILHADASEAARWMRDEVVRAKASFPATRH